MGKNKKRRTSDDTATKFPYAPSYLEQMQNEGKIISRFSKHSGNGNDFIVDSVDDIKEYKNSIVADSNIMSAFKGDVANVSTCKNTMINDSNNENESSTMIYQRIGSRYYVIGFSKPCIKHISGICKITLVKGKININGYSLKIGVVNDVVSPSWTPACRICITEKNNSTTTQNININMFQFLDDKSFRNKINECFHSISSVILVESLVTNELEWMLRGDMGYAKFNSNLESQQNNIQYVSETASSNGILMNSAAIGSHEYLSSLQVDHTRISPEWTSSLDTICKGIKSNKSPSIVVCGGKGVGKSTFMKYTVNRLLHKAKAVAVIDCDVGQPEFNPPSMASLHIITSPILSPSYVNMKTPHKAFYIGDYTIKNSPVEFVNVIQKLFQEYSKILHGEISLPELEGLFPNNTTNVLGNNTFNLLDEDDDGNGSQILLPLVVNTDGWIRNIGAQNLCSIVSIVNPSDFCYITTNANDRPLDAASILSTSCTLHTLCSGAGSSSKNIGAVDFRNLRFASYFLRFSPHLNDYQKTNSVDSPDIIICGAIVDRNKHLNNAFLHCPQLIIPFEQLQLRLACGSHEIPSRLMLSAFNGMIVAISIRSDFSTGSKKSKFRVPITHLDAISKIQFTNSGVSANNDYVEFLLDCSNIPASEFFECHGLGIVSAIDIVDHNIILKIPWNMQLLDLTDKKICLVLGSTQLPASQLFVEEAYTTPYLSTEVYGSGTGIISTRSNVKRRSQNHQDDKN